VSADNIVSYCMIIKKYPCSLCCSYMECLCWMGGA